MTDAGKTEDRQNSAARTRWKTATLVVLFALVFSAGFLVGDRSNTPVPPVAGADVDGGTPSATEPPSDPMDSNASVQKKVVFMSYASGAELHATSIQQNISFIESLPFDGVIVKAPPSSYQVMNPYDVVSYDEVYNDNLKHVRGIFQRFTHNYALIREVADPGDFYDDAVWERVSANFGVFARATRDAGLRGIFFDNEVHTGDYLWDYELGAELKATYSKEEYAAKARERGRQVMSAVVSEFPNIEMTVLIGPYASEESNPWVRPGDNNLYDLAGPFFAGMVEASVGTGARIVDGGEMYTLRTPEEFSHWADFRKNAIASASLDSPNIPESLRPHWPQQVDVSFGVYTEDFREKNMDPTVMRSTLENALRASDEFVWFYTESAGWLSPPGPLGQAWMPAIEGARSAANAGITS